MSAAGSEVVYLPGRESSMGFYTPASGRVRETAVMIGTPFGWGEVSTYRGRREWAARLAGLGHPTLRFDLPGTGNSAGSPLDPGRLAAWVSATGGAAEWLRAKSCCERVAAVGIGLSGLVACRAIADGAPIDELVLWAVPSSGRRFVRELRAFARMEAVQAGDGGDGSIAAGFVLSSGTVAELELLDASRIEFPPSRPGRALLLAREGIEDDGMLASRLAACGAEVTEVTGGHYGTLMSRGERALALGDVFGPIERWLEHSRARAAQAPRRERARRPPQASHELVLSDGSRELPIDIEQPFGRMLAIVTEPAEPAHDVCVILSNSGAIRSIGPNRMWVEFARRWARSGVRSIRVDLEGLGDSDGVRGADARSVHDAARVGQLCAVIDEVIARDLARRVVLIGHCSGAYLSFRAALRREAVVAAMLLNPRVLVQGATLPGARSLARAARVRPLVRGLQGADRVWRTVAAAAQSRLDGPGLDASLDRLRDRDVELLIGLTAHEPMLERLLSGGYVQPGGPWPNVSFERLHGSDHILRPLRAQRETHELLDREMRRVLDSSAARA